jgi:hypothetical protein
VHRATHHRLTADDLVEEHVLVERTEDNKEAPVLKPRMRKATPRPEQRVLTRKITRRLHRRKVTSGNFPTGVKDIPLELPF